MEITVSERNKAIDLDQQIKSYANAAWQNLIESAKCLKKMRDTKLYTELGYESFEEYTVNSLNIKERQAYTYISTLEKCGEAFLQSNANLGITKLSLISNIPAIDRQDVVENNDIGEMSVEEVKKLVAENDAKGEQISLLSEEVSVKEKELKAAGDSEAALKEKIASLEKALENEKNKPTEVAVLEPSPEQLAEIEKTAKENAQKEFEEKLKAETKAIREKAKTDAEKKFASQSEQLQKLKLKADMAESEKAVLKEKAEKLQGELKVVASSETVKFSLLFEEMQSLCDKIIASLKKIDTENKDNGAKFQKAMLALCDNLKSKTEGAIGAK